jgi:CRP-like cAMP-binding protein
MPLLSPSTAAIGASALSIARRCEVLAQTCLPAVLPEPQIMQLAHATQPRRYLPGQAVLVRGNPAASAWLVAEGSVELGVRQLSGSPRRLAGAGQWLDLPSAVLGLPHAEDAVAATDCLLLELPLEDAMHGSNGRATEFFPALAVMLAAEASRLSELVRGLATKDALGRLATWLVAQANADDPTVPLRLPLRKRDLAAQLGTTAETFSRALSKLRTMGIVRVHGRLIALLDRPALERLAEPRAPA